jgi:hypothetical protein
VYGHNIFFSVFINCGPTVLNVRMLCRYLKHDDLQKNGTTELGSIKITWPANNKSQLLGVQFIMENKQISETWYSHCRYNEHYYLTLQSDIQLPTFRRNLLLPSSRWKRLLPWSWRQQLPRKNCNNLKGCTASGPWRNIMILKKYIYFVFQISLIFRFH